MTIKTPILRTGVPDPTELPDNEALFRQLMAQHRTRLHRFVVRRIGHSDEADDIAQQAFCEAALSFSRFRGEAELSTWLYGIAMNLVRNYLVRAPCRRYRFETDEALQTVSSTDSDPSELLYAKQTMLRLADSMDELPVEMREVLTLIGIEENSYEGTAAILSVPIGTVRSRLSRARTALRSRLALAHVERP